MKRQVTIVSLLVLVSALAQSRASAEDFGKDTLKGISSVRVASVTFDSEAQVRLNLTTEQLQAKIESILIAGGLKVVKEGGDATVVVAIKLGKATLPVVVSDRPLVTREVPFWMYRVDTAVKQDVTINRPAGIPAVQANIPTWRVIGGGILTARFDEGIKEVLIGDHLPKLIADWKAVTVK